MESLSDKIQDGEYGEMIRYEDVREAVKELKEWANIYYGLDDRSMLQFKLKEIFGEKLI